MEVILTLVYLIVVAAALLLLQWFRKWFAKYSRFSKIIDSIPGPAPLPFIGNVLGLIIKPENQFLDEMGSFVKYHSPIFRLWVGPFMGTVHITSWKYLEKILNSSTQIEKSSFYKFLIPGIGTGLLTSEGEKWQFRRKLINPAFHRTILDGYQEIISEKSEQLVNTLFAKSQEKRPFNIASLLCEWSLELICETAMGINMNFQADIEEKDKDYLAAVEDFSEIFIQRCWQPWLHPDILFNLSPKGRRYNECVRIAHNFSAEVIQVRKKEYFKSCQAKINSENNEHKKKRESFLDLLIKTAYSVGYDKKPILSDKDIREEVDTFMARGHDTTANAISWAIYLLGRHPEIQEQVYQEIHDVLGNDMDITSQKLSMMTLLDRCVKEGLRLYPSAPFIGRKLREDVTVGEYTIPAECEVFILIYFLHRDPEIFPDPEKFNPDNFLPEVCEKRPPYTYIPFSAGPRNCIGQRYALLIEKTVLCYIIKKFRIEAVDDPKDLKHLAGLVIRSQDGINITLHPRS